MVCAADDTMIAGDWVNVSTENMNVKDVLPPLTEAPAEETKNLDTTADDELVSLEVRQKRQQEAQRAFLKEQGLFKEESEDVVLLKEEDSPSLDGTVVEDEEEDATDEQPLDAFQKAKNAARKAGVAAAGGALVAVGAVLTPLPTPGGILLAGAGLGVLSTEFECAKKVLDTGKEKLVDLIDSIPEAEKDDDETELIEKESQDSFDDDISAISEETEKTTIPRKAGDFKSSVQDRARTIGKSIRPFLTDEDAPRKAMNDLNASTKRVLGSAKGKLDSFVAYALVLDYEAPPVELTTLAATAPSPFGGGYGMASGLRSMSGRSLSVEPRTDKVTTEARPSSSPSQGDSSVKPNAYTPNIVEVPKETSASIEELAEKQEE